MATVITSTRFGTLPDGRETSLFTLDDGNGVTVRITNYGGTVTSMHTPDRDGKRDEIGLGFDNVAAYASIVNYYGSIIGRVGNRIADGRFTLDGKEYRLWLNPGGEHLHGGQKGFDAKLWDARPEDGGLRLDYLSPDGEEHYPGNLAVTVRYTLENGELRIAYEARTDKTTIVNLTNHSYFNLNGYKRDILAHDIRIQASSYTPVNDKLIPTGEIAPVAGTPFDFTAMHAIGRDMQQVPGGYDHNFIFSRKSSDSHEWLVEAHDPDSGRTLAMATTEPCTQLYTGNFLDGTMTGHGGTVYRKHFGFCLEAQKPPDAINHPNFPSIVLKPDEVYRQTTVYRFGVE